MMFRDRSSRRVRRSVWRVGAAIGAAGVLTVVSPAAWAQGFSVVGAGDRGDSRAQGGSASNAGGNSGSGDMTARGLAASGQTAVITNAGEIRGNGAVRASVEPRHPWEYGGISPGGTGAGSGNVPRWWTRAVRRNARSGRLVIAWPGFQLTPNGSRVFLAVSGAPQITPQPSAGRLVYHIRNALVPVYNNRRALETAAFETPVARAYLRPRGRDVDLVIELRGSGEPQMTQSPVGEGLQFVYFEFGPWTPPASSGGGGSAFGGSNGSSSSSGGRGSAGQGIRPAAGSGQQVPDDEAPPPVTR